MANLVPKVNNVGSLGTASKVWNNIHVSTTSFANSSITENSGSIKLKSLPVLVEGALTVQGSLAVSAQSGSLNLNSQKIINLGTPTLAADAATKSYVDSVLQGLDVKASVRAATAANGALGSAFANGQSIDGVSLATNDRILIKNQTTASENGIYIVNASGAPDRASDLAASSSAAGVFVFVEEGTANADTGFVCTSNASADTVGTHSLAFTQFSGAGQLTAGNGLNKSGNTLSVNVDDASIEIDSDTLRVKASGITSSMIASGAINSSLLSSSAITGQSVKNSVNDSDLILISDSSDSNNLKKINRNDLFAGNTTSGVMPYFSAGFKLNDFLIDEDFPSGDPTKQYLRLSMWRDEDGTSEPGLLIENTNSDNSGGALIFSNKNAGVTDNKLLGHIEFRETESNKTFTDWATIQGKVVDHSSVYGGLDLNVVKGGNPSAGIKLEGSANGINVDIPDHNGSTAGLKLGGTLVTASAAELNLFDGGTAVGSSITIADSDGLFINDGGTLKSVPATDLKTYVGSSTSLSGLSDTDITSPSAGHVLVYDGTNSFDNVAISGDMTLSSAGVLTIQAGAVEGSMLNDNIVSGQAEMTGDVADTDELLISDAGTVKRADFSVVRDAVFADITGDALVAAGGSLTIQSGSVEGSMLHDNVISQKTELAAGLASTDELLVSDAGSLKRMDVSVLQGYLQSNLTFATALTQENVEDYVGGMVSGNTETFISVSYDDSDGTLDFVVPVKDEDDLSSDSATHLATQQSIKAYVDAQVAGGGLNIDGYSALGGVGLHQTEDHFVFSDNGTEKKITFSNLQDAVFAGISGDALVAAGGALTIQATSVENSMLAGSIANAKLANSAVVIGSTSTALGATSTALAGLTQLDVDNIRVNGNTISSTDANGNMILSPNGTGKVIVDGDGTTSNGGVSIENGLIDLKNGGSVSKIKFYCESSNAHAQTLQGAPHSASASNTLVLPAAAGTLVGTGDSGTVSNTMLAGSITAAKLNNAIFADLETLGAPASDGQFIVATGSGAFAYESANTARTSLGLGTGSSPTFTSLTLSAQAAAIAMNSQKITGLATPTADGDAATKAYVDSVAEGLDVKDSVHVASTANIASLLDGCDAGATIDGVVLVAGDRVLLKDQSTASENGIYIVAADGVAPARAADMAASSSAAGVFVFVEEGTANADAGFVCTSNSGADTVGTHSLAFTQFSGAGQVTAGDGLAKSGNSLSVNVDDSSIETNSDSLRVKAGGITNAMLADDAVGADELAANAVVNASVVDGAIKADKLDIDGSTDIGADLVDADLIVVDDGAGGTNRKSALSRIKKYIYSAMTGDATSSDAGVLTLATSSVEGSMLNDDVISGQTAMTGDVADADELLISDNGTVKRADFSVVRDAVFNDVSGDATIAAGGALTLAASSVEGSMLNASAITGQTAETSIADDDLIIISDTSASGALRKMTKANFVSGLGGGSTAADDLTAGDAAVTLTTTTGNITIDAQAGDSDIIFKGTDGSSDITMLTLDGSDAGTAIFNHDIKLQSDQSKLFFGADNDVHVTHVADSGLLVQLDNGGTGEPQVEIKSTHTNFSGPTLVLNHGGSDGTGDMCGRIQFERAGATTSYMYSSGIPGTNATSLDLRVCDATQSTPQETLKLEGSSAAGKSYVNILKHNTGSVQTDNGGLKLGNVLVTSAAFELNKLDGATVTTTEINLLDGGTAVGSSITIADADGFIINDAGTMKTIPASDLKTYIGAGAADDLTAGDAAVTLTTTSGNITIDAQANDSDIIFAGTDNSSHITMLTLDGSDAGTAIFNHDIKMQNDGAVLSLGTNGDVSLTHVHDAGLTLNSTRYLSFNDTGTKVWSSEDGQLDLASDGTMVDSVLVNAASGGVKLNAGLDGNAAAIHLDSASGVTIAGGDNNDSVYVENSPLELEQISAPSTTTNKLYNVGGTLTWNGSAVGGGGGSATIPKVLTGGSAGSFNLLFESAGNNGDNEKVYLINNSTNARTVTLPTYSGNGGKKFQVKVLGTGNVTIAVQSGESIEGTSNGTFVLSTQYESVTLIANDSGTLDGWYIV